MSYRPHVRCRACGYGPPLNAIDIKSGDQYRLESVLNLGVLPLPNAFRKGNASRPGHYPVELLVCPRCTLGQLSAVVDPEVLYSDYPYITSDSATMRDHFNNLWVALNKEREIDSVVEIGSNDGLLLDHFRCLGAGHVMGIDPAKNLVKKANERGVNTVCSLFDRDAANMAQAAMPPVDLVLARHVFCHIDDWQQFIVNVAVLCSKETLVCIEVPYAGDMIRKVEWDTVYAEHTSYLTIKALQYLLDGSPLRIQTILTFPIHGGAIGVLLRRRDSEAPANGGLQKYIEEERCSMEDWKTFAGKSRDQITNLELMVKGFVQDGKTVVGYGASAKSTMWVNACRFTREHVRFITDNTPQKLYSTAPGTNIPITDPGAILRDLPDYVILWAWNYEAEILEKEKLAREKGVQFIIPTNPIRIV